MPGSEVIRRVKTRPGRTDAGLGPDPEPRCGVTATMRPEQQTTKIKEGQTWGRTKPGTDRVPSGLSAGRREACVTMNLPHIENALVPRRAHCGIHTRTDRRVWAMFQHCG